MITKGIWFGLGRDRNRTQTRQAFATSAIVKTFCCSTFDDLVSSAGKAGFSVVLRQLGPVRAFCLQSRAHDADQEHKVRNLPRAPDPPRPFYVLVEQYIQHCPFCGSSLGPLILEKGESLDALVQAHLPFAKF